MTNKRRSYSDAEELALTTQVDGQCPLCGDALFYIKKAKHHKAYELAHIYPLNPTPEELQELKDVKRLHEDVNHPDNLIPLCRSCHVKFDKPRTAQEYAHLAEKKKQLLRRADHQKLQLAYPLEDDIKRVLIGLHAMSALNDRESLEYDPKSLLEKFDDTLPLPTRQKIKNAVSDYYSFVRSEFLELERQSPATSDVISSQVRTYYLKQKSLGLNQLEMFNSVVKWICFRANPETVEAAEIVASYFVQNCEVFE